MRGAGRSAILDAALATLSTSGEASPEVVARAAGVSKALVFHHFGSAAGLQDAMAARVLAQTQAGLDALAREFPNPYERVEALARALLAEPPEAPASARHVARFWLGGQRGPARDALVLDFVVRSLKEARAGGDPVAAGLLILSRWHGATLVYANGGRVDFEAEAEDLVVQLRRGRGR